VSSEFYMSKKHFISPNFYHFCAENLFVLRKVFFVYCKPVRKPIVPDYSCLAIIRVVDPYSFFTDPDGGQYGSGSNTDPGL
jgi:hypothetical protein